VNAVFDSLRGRSRAGRLLRVVGPVGLFLMLGGTSPGSVGSCAGTGNFADFQSFCVSNDTLVCSRLQRAEAMGIVPTCAENPNVRCFEAANCGPGTIQNNCQVATQAGGWETVFPPNCVPPPTVTQAQRCLQALQVRSLDTPENQIPECQAALLCE